MRSGTLPLSQRGLNEGVADGCGDLSAERFCAVVGVEVGEVGVVVGVGVGTSVGSGVSMRITLPVGNARSTRSSVWVAKTYFEVINSTRALISSRFKSERKEMRDSGFVGNAKPSNQYPAQMA